MPLTIAGQLRAKEGRLLTCYQREINADPGLAGRVELVWTVADGRVEGAQVVHDTTGNVRLTSCLTRTMGRLRFSGVEDGEYGPWPFVFRPR